MMRRSSHFNKLSANERSVMNGFAQPSTDIVLQADKSPLLRRKKSIALVSPTLLRSSRRSSSDKNQGKRNKSVSKDQKSDEQKTGLDSPRKKKTNTLNTPKRTQSSLCRTKRQTDLTETGVNPIRIPRGSSASCFSPRSDLHNSKGSIATKATCSTNESDDLSQKSLPRTPLSDSPLRCPVRRASPPVVHLIPLDNCNGSLIEPLSPRRSSTSDLKNTARDNLESRSRSSPRRSISEMPVRNAKLDWNLQTMAYVATEDLESSNGDLEDDTSTNSNGSLIDIVPSQAVAVRRSETLLHSWPKARTFDRHIFSKSTGELSAIEGSSCHDSSANFDEDSFPGIMTWMR